MNNDELNALGAKILDACITVHRELGPGLLESVYVIALYRELELRGLRVLKNVNIPLYYKDIDTGKSYEMDLLVEDEIIIEAKAAEVMHPVFDAQLISYLKLSNRPLGYLVNFNVVKMKDGFKRFVNGF